MVSVEDTVKTFLECLNISMNDKTEEEREKIRKIMQKSIVDLCYAIVPESDTLVSERGIFQPSTPEKGSVMKAFFNEQRKAFFALATGIVSLKNRMEQIEVAHKNAVEDLENKLDMMESRVKGVVKMRNTALGVPPQTPPTRIKR